MTTLHTTFKKIFLPVIFSLLIFSFLSDKNKIQDGPFHAFLKAMNMSFVMPDGYAATPVKGSYQCGDGKITSSIEYFIVNKDSSLIIGFHFVGIPDSNSLVTIRRFTPNWDPNKNYLKIARLRADTLNHKLIFYGKDDSKRIFNADDAGEYVKVCRYHTTTGI